jgi:NodT family efflux transporter outer membrane factor (OMF) lipoprotein
MRIPRFTLSVWAMAALALTGCASGPAGTGLPERAGATVPAQWQQASAPAGRALSLDDAWWKAFNDSTLDALVDRVLAENISLSASALKVRQARLRADLAEGDRWPTVAARVSTQGAQPLEGGSTTRTSTASLSATWEVDFWGRLSAARDLQVWEAKATEDDRRALALSLVGTTTRLYWQMAYLDQRLQSAQQSLDYARKTQSLVDAQYQAGSVGGLEQAQAQQAVLAQEAALAALVQTREEARQALALLLDGPTQTAQLPGQYTWPQGAWPVVQAGVPAEVLARRPDLRAAEYRMREAYAGLTATRAAYYPNLTLTAAVGGSSQDLKDVLRDPVGTLAAALVLPFVQFREMARNTAIAQADADAAVLTFRQTLYQALSDVDKGLSAQVQAERQTQALTSRLAQARKVERLTEVRYRAGAEPLKSWLDAQEARRTAELALADARYSQLSSYVGLVQALGGHVPLAEVPTERVATVDSGR